MASDGAQGHAGKLFPAGAAQIAWATSSLGLNQWKFLVKGKKNKNGKDLIRYVSEKTDSVP